MKTLDEIKQDVRRIRRGTNTDITVAYEVAAALEALIVRLEEDRKPQTVVKHPAPWDIYCG